MPNAIRIHTTEKIRDQAGIKAVGLAVVWVVVKRVVVLSVGVGVCICEVVVLLGVAVFGVAVL